MRQKLDKLKNKISNTIGLVKKIDYNSKFKKIDYDRKITD